ncbi:hypothetical protein O9G_006394 [Rozella allomycis CSF55]|uniref:Uncharacterized protein n=1 Tax=Rozella allomycis (strain CSF55) TaxID=988480 RepID=A0A075B1U1_ROZAC|nr:hypothetical protein O9G_006394 [Rozella allomycis CSF55]|eukprot:EPZ36328.1 hypothetical protein O9G_006394 [Rozella allomycis CSF55]
MCCITWKTARIFLILHHHCLGLNILLLKLLIILLKLLIILVIVVLLEFKREIYITFIIVV